MRLRERERESRSGFAHAYDSIISFENLLESWKEFSRDKKRQKEVMEFSAHLMDNIFLLRRELSAKTYRHGPYRPAKICDPKPRDIHIAPVRDRLLHHAIYAVVYPYFDRTFVFDSYSCRRNKGTHRAFKRFCEYARDASYNYTRTVWVLKCDIRKFFANIDHVILKEILARHIKDVDTTRLFATIVDSFHTDGRQGIGLPLGNLTSQLLVNVYMNEFDQFLKRELRVRHFVRYADDFIVLHERKEYLLGLLPQLSEFLEKRLKLSLHPDKVFVKTLASGVDFLGWVHFPAHRVLRTTTRRRMFRRLQGEPKDESVNSYLGLLSHGNTYTLKKEVYRLQSYPRRT